MKYLVSQRVWTTLPRCVRGVGCTLPAGTATLFWRLTRSSMDVTMTLHVQMGKPSQTPTVQALQARWPRHRSCVMGGRAVTWELIVCGSGKIRVLAHQSSSGSNTSAAVSTGCVVCNTKQQAVTISSE